MYRDASLHKNWHYKIFYSTYAIVNIVQPQSARFVILLKTKLLILMGQVQ